VITGQHWYEYGNGCSSSISEDVGANCTKSLWDYGEQIAFMKAPQHLFPCIVTNGNIISVLIYPSKKRKEETIPRLMCSPEYIHIYTLVAHTYIDTHTSWN
jgi:hypothetical protein